MLWSCEMMQYISLPLGPVYGPACGCHFCEDLLSIALLQNCLPKSLGNIAWASSLLWSFLVFICGTKQLCFQRTGVSWPVWSLPAQCWCCWLPWAARELLPVVHNRLDLNHESWGVKTWFCRKHQVISNNRSKYAVSSANKGHEILKYMERD